MAKSVQPKHEFMLVRPRPDIHQEFTTLSMNGGEIDTKLFGKIRLDNLVQYKHSGIRNQFAFGEVLRFGSGLVAGPSSELPDVQVGTLIGFDLAQVAIECPSKELSAMGVEDTETVYFVPFKAALCRFAVGEHLPSPLGNYVLTEEDQIAMSRFHFGGPTGLVLPQTVASAGVRTNSNPNSNVRYAAERILSHGPGKWIKKVFQSPDCGPGEIALFSSVLSVDFHAYSKRYRFTPWTQIMGTVEP